MNLKVQFYSRFKNKSYQQSYFSVEVTDSRAAAFLK